MRKTSSERLHSSESGETQNSGTFAAPRSIACLLVGLEDRGCEGLAYIGKPP